LASVGNGLQLWDVSSGRRLAVLDGHTSDVKSVA